MKASLNQRRKSERESKRKRKSKRKPGRPSSGKKCPRCGKVGSPQLKAVKNRRGGNEYKYVYYAHPTGPHMVRWCYVGGKKKDGGKHRSRGGVGGDGMRRKEFKNNR